ncbi:Flagellar basal-body rod protein FlgC [Acidisarcina polymorpha]|uniref:Flagellar basal-body rod protein FlgC n=1 Tax=Acidisarcina polymorpha TaxID=2211140 RepID=A0A2Z5FSR4_9BACT|nr:flagellar basal body rod protein FlgC [Acidisarcina polymorpha]AXC09525.1 Flagellar basal-body rod protein FlgC [Acidisarcina polymorpha]
MNLFGVLEVSGSALKAERIRAEVVAANMANAETTRTADGTPYRRQHVVFGSSAEAGDSFQNQLLSANGLALRGPSYANQPPPGGVEVTAVVADKATTLRRYDPQHPDADKDGYVAYPDINPLTEMADLMGATRAYGLNSSAIQATKSMIAASLDILK